MFGYGTWVCDGGEEEVADNLLVEQEGCTPTEKEKKKVTPPSLQERLDTCEVVVREVESGECFYAKNFT